MKIKNIALIVAAFLVLTACSLEVGYPSDEPTVSLHASEPEAPVEEDAPPEEDAPEEEETPPEEESVPEEEPSPEPAQSSSSAASSKAADKPAAASSKAATPSAKVPTAPKPADKTVEEGYLSEVEDRVLELINEERVENGLEELALDYDLLRGARIRSREMFTYNYFAHSRPDGRDWSTIFYEDLDILTVARGENLAMVTVTNGGLAHQTARYWVSAWINSTQHYANMLEKGYTHAAIGIYYHYDGTAYHTYATNLFARY